MKNEPVIEIERTPEFFEAAKALNDFVDGLNLSTKKNNELVRLVCAQVIAAEKGGFACGFGVGFKAGELYDAMPKGAGGVLS